MDKLKSKILAFDSWERPWTFYDSISNDDQLSRTDTDLFKEIWTKASEFDLWNFTDLTQGCNASKRFIADNYELSDEIINKIVRAISYQWK